MEENTRLSYEKLNSEETRKEYNIKITEELRDIKENIQDEKVED